MNKIFQALIRIVQFIGELCWIHKLKTTMVLVFCFLAEAINNPHGFINFWLCSLIDLLADVLPGTPDNLKIANILMDFAASYPFIGFGIIWDVIYTLLVITSLQITIKIVRLVRG